MRITRYFKEIMAEIIPQFWSQEEKEALLRIIYEIYTCDYTFSPYEVKDFKKKLNVLGCDMKRVKRLNLDEAIDILKKNKLKKELIYIIIAEAIFKDEDYDSIEREYIDRFVKKYDIPQDILNDKITRIRNEKFEKVLFEWYRQIKNTNL